MATDATGPVSPLGIPTIDPDADAPSGLGENAIISVIDTLITARVPKPAGIVSGEVPVWNGASWDRSSTTRVGPSSLGSGTPDASKVLAGDGSWQGGMVKISETILGASAATIDITGIPATFRHLKIIQSLRCDQVGGSFNVSVRLNNDSGANYSDVLWQAGAGSAAESNSATSWVEFGANGTTATASMFWDCEMLIPNYARTDRTKNYTALHAANFAMTTGQHLVRMGSGVWNSTAAVNRITLSMAAGNFIAGSTFAIYGIG